MSSRFARLRQANLLRRRADAHDTIEAGPADRAAAAMLRLAALNLEARVFEAGDEFLRHIPGGSQFVFTRIEVHGHSPGVDRKTKEIPALLPDIETPVEASDLMDTAALHDVIQGLPKRYGHRPVTVNPDHA